MKPGRASQTAVLVCMARAAAHGTTKVASFTDPTALWLLPDAFDVVHDEALPAIGARLSSEVAQGTRIMRHMRIATAVRLASSLPSGGRS